MQEGDAPTIISNFPYLQNKYISKSVHLLRNMLHHKKSLTFSSAILMPLLNLRIDSKEEMVFVRRTFTVGLETTVIPPSMMLVV